MIYVGSGKLYSKICPNVILDLRSEIACSAVVGGQRSRSTGGMVKSR